MSETILSDKVLRLLLKAYGGEEPQGSGNAHSGGVLGEGEDLSASIPFGRSQPNDMAIQKRAAEYQQEWNPETGKMETNPTEATRLFPEATDPVGHVLHSNKHEENMQQNNLPKMIGGGIRGMQMSPIGRGLGGLLYGHGALLGGLSSGAIGYGLGKLYNKFTGSDSSVAPWLLAALGGLTGGMTGHFAQPQKTAGWKSEQSYGIESTAGQIVARISQELSYSQRQRVEAALRYKSTTELNSIMLAIQNLALPVAAGVVLKAIGISNAGSILGALAIGAATFKWPTDVNTAGSPVRRYANL